jgi:hypothetical protein
MMDAAPEEWEELDVDDVIDGVGARPFGLLFQMRLRVVLGLWVASLFPDEAAEDEDEDDEEEKANEKRDGELGSPIRITVPFEAAESGRGMSGEDIEPSSRVDRASLAGFFLRPVRPPDGRRVRLGA